MFLKTLSQGDVSADSVGGWEGLSERGSDRGCPHTWVTGKFPTVTSAQPHFSALSLLCVYARVSVPVVVRSRHQGFAYVLV